MIPFIPPVHQVSVVPLSLKQVSEPHKSSSSDVPLLGWGFILILTILVGRRLIIRLNRKYQSRCSIVMLQRQATLERLLTYRFSHEQASAKNKIQQR